MSDQKGRKCKDCPHMMRDVKKKNDYCWFDGEQTVRPDDQCHLSTTDLVAIREQGVERILDEIENLNGIVNLVKDLQDMLCGRFNGIVKNEQQSTKKINKYVR